MERSYKAILKPAVEVPMCYTRSRLRYIVMNRITIYTHIVPMYMAQAYWADMSRLTFGVVILGLYCVRPLLAAPPLLPYGVDINQTSVSGVSSGAAMAVQMHVAYSSIMRGVGVIAGVVYDCANSTLPSATASLVQGLACMDGSFDFAPGAETRTGLAAANGYIDDPANLAHQKV